jgi:predicted P-loop ATPase
VEQLWSEAVIRYRAGEPTYIKDRDVVEALRHHTATRYQGDVWTEAVMAYAERPQNNQNVSIPEVLEHVGIERGRWSRSDELRVAKILKSEGWERRQVYAGGRRSWRYFLPKLVTVGGSVGDGNEP